MASDLHVFDFWVGESRDLCEQQRCDLLALFETNYRQANRDYLVESLEKLRHVAIARDAGVAVGFAVGETRVIDLPRLPAQVVSLAGMCCVAPAARRRGLFAELERLALAAAEVPRTSRLLWCGRMAHPIIMRVMTRIPTSLPMPGIAPTLWQKDVGCAIAAVYGAHGFDRETFVCKGSGRPVGYPIIDVEAEPSEIELFEAVDRDQGDSLLCMAWVPDAPEGW